MARFAVFKVQRSSALHTRVSVDYQTVDGTATSAGGDYTPASGTLIFEPNESEKEVRIAVRSSEESSPEQFSLRLSNPVKAGLSTKEATAVLPAGSSGLESMFLIRDLAVLFYSGEAHPGAPGELSDSDWDLVPTQATQDDPGGNPTEDPFPGYMGQFHLNAGPFAVRAGGGAIQLANGWYLHYLVSAIDEANSAVQVFFGDTAVIPPTPTLEESTKDAFNAWWDSMGASQVRLIDSQGATVGTVILSGPTTEPDGADPLLWRGGVLMNVPWSLTTMDAVVHITLEPFVG